MEITNKDVKVLGRVASITTDGIVASAEQVYDDTYKEGMFQSDINKELLESIGEVNVPTKVSELENDSNYQSAEQVEQKINGLINSAPEALDTLKELADALNSDPNFATTVTNQLSNKADKTELDKYLPLSGGEMTGSITSGITTYGSSGVIIEDKTENDLLNAAGSTTTLKTVNGQSIFGEGNIEINSGDVFPEGGEEGQVLTKTADGTAWQDPQAAFPEGGTTGQVLKKTAEGVEWANDTDTTYQNATQDAAGLMSSSDKTKLDSLISIPTGGTDGQVLTKTSSGVAWENVQTGSSFPEGGTIGQVLKKTESGTEWANDNNTTYENASQSSAGLMSSADKIKLDNLVEIPSGGTEGQVLKKTSTGVEWGNDNDTKYTLPTASNTVLGGVKVGEGLSVTGDGILSCTITPGSDTVSWDNITGKPSFATVATSGSYNDLTDKPAAYTLPTATSSQLGGVKIGEGITVQADGTISAADDVVTLVNLSAAKGDIAATCAVGPFIANLYFINSPVTGGILAGIDTGDYYHLCVKRSTGDDYYETTCSNVAGTFSNINAYFNIVGTVIYLKNNVIYHATQGTDAGYFVSNEKGNTFTNVASRFETLAEARAFMREKMLALPDKKMLALPDIGIVKCTSEEYEGGAKDENTLYIIHG